MKTLLWKRLLGLGLVAGLATGVVLAESPKTEAKAEASASAGTIDDKIIEEITKNSKLMKNLQHLCDVIGPRVTGSAKLEKANNWAADKMKEYGLENVKLEPYEIPVGWERGTASMTLVEPNPGKQMIVASAAWVPGTKGKITGPVVFLDAKTKDDLEKYKGKLKDAIVLRSPPAEIKPISDLSYLNPAQRPAQPMNPMGEPKKDDVKKDEPKKDDVKKDDTKKEEPKKEEPKKEAQPPAGGGGRGPGFGEMMALQQATAEFLRNEGAAVMLRDSAKPHGLLTMTGSWPRANPMGGGDRATPSPEPMPSLFITHEHYRMLYRLATTKDGPTPKVEVEITNKFIPGPITVYNTVGEIKGSEKPDEFVVLGAHIDSWDLGTGATDNGTGTCTVLECARTLGALAKAGIKPKRTIRFVLFSGEEQGLYGSKAYVKKHKDEMDKTSCALVHDTGTGAVYGFGMQGREAVKKVLEPELESLKNVAGFKGLSLRSISGTDHQSFEAVGVPGFACDQDMDEYRLTHHTQTDTFDHAKEENLVQGAKVMAVTAMRVANLKEMLPRDKPVRPMGGGRGPGGPGGGTPPAEEKKTEEKKPPQ
jgi:carboxypeptidase Q